MPKARASIYYVYSSTLFSGLIFEEEMTCIPRTARYVVRNQAETAEDAKSTSEHLRIVYSSTLFSGLTSEDEIICIVMEMLAHSQSV